MEPKLRLGDYDLTGEQWTVPAPEPLDYAAMEQAYIDDYYTSHPATRLHASACAIRDELLKPFERFAGWLAKRF